jgi:mannosyltransferase OCH1-like enzyme
VKHPKIIHRIWLGTDQPSARNVGFTDRWADLHPGWDMIVWDDDRAEAIRPLIFDHLYENAPTVVHRADLLRVEAVLRMGGMYTDFDMEPLRNLEKLIGRSTGWTTPDADGMPGNALFGAQADHPGLRTILETIRGRATTGWATPNMTCGPHAWAAAGATLDLLGTTETAYPVHWSDRERLTQTAVQLGLDGATYAYHHFDGSWTH